MITSFNESPLQSISGIRNLINIDPKTFWETESDLAVLIIEFDPMRNFSVKISRLYIGYENPFALTIFFESIEIFNKVYKKGATSNIHSYKFMKKEFLVELNSLRLEFRRTSENIKINFLLLKESKIPLIKQNGEKDTKSQNDIVYDTTEITKKSMKKIQKEVRFSDTCLLERASRRAKKKCDSTEINRKSLEAKKIKASIENDVKNFDGRGNDKDSKEYINKCSYESLLTGQVVYCDIQTAEIKKVVLDLLQASGACYIENKTNFCTLVIVEIIKEQDSNKRRKIPKVSPQWLFQSVAKRKVLDFNNYK